MYYHWSPYVPVGERRRKATAEMAKLKKRGEAVSPVVIQPPSLLSQARAVLPAAGGQGQVRVQ